MTNARTEAIREACVDAASAASEHAPPRARRSASARDVAGSAMRSLDPARHARRRVRDVMTTEVATLRPDDPLAVADDVMRLGRIRHLPVLDADGVLVGLVSHRDLLRSARLAPERSGRGAPRSHLKTLRVADVMTRDVVVAAPDDTLREAAAVMLHRKLGCLPVVENDELVGILTEADFVGLVL